MKSPAEMTDAGLLVQHMSLHREFEESADANLQMRLKSAHDQITDEMHRRGFAHQYISFLDKSAEIISKQLGAEGEEGEMPWTVSDPPSVAKNWTEAEKEKCVSAANAVLEEGGSEEDAIYACIHSAGKSEEKESDQSLNKEGEKEKWSTAFINDLPDAAFAYIEPGGEKDDEGKTTPRSKRHFPHHNKSVKSATENSSVDLPHLRNALSRAPQSPHGKKAIGHLKRHASALDVGTDDSSKELIWNDEWDDVEKESLDEKVYNIRDSAYEALTPPPQPVEASSYPSPYIKEVWEGFVIVGLGGSYYKITYAESDDGYTFADRDDWIEVAWSWQPVSSKELGHNIVTISPDLQPAQICATIPSQVSGGAGGESSGATKEQPPRWRLMDRIISNVRDAVKELLLGKDDFTSTAAFGGETTLTAFKDKDDNWRWLAITSTAVQDRENEIVSRSAIDKGIERAKQLGTAGDLRFWHTDISLGTCDFQARDDLCLIESGIWHDDIVSKSVREDVAENPGKYRMSIRFLYPSSGVFKESQLRIYNDMAFVERSILPAGREAALFTYVNPGGNVMRKDKEDALRIIAGDEIVDEVLGKSAQVAKSVEEAGLATKELDPVEKALASVEDEATRQVLKEALEAKQKESPEPEEEEEKAPEKKEEPEPMPEKAAENEALAEAFKEALSPLSERMAALEASMKEMQDAPRHANPLFRASSSKETEVSDDEKVPGPGGDPDVLDMIVGSIGLGVPRPTQ